MTNQPSEGKGIKEKCPNCLEQDENIKPMPDGSCGVCGGKGYIEWKRIGKIMTNQKSLDKKKTLRSICKDERYCYWYLCPSCLQGAIGDGDRFCANCGLNLKDYKFIHDKI